MSSVNRNRFMYSTLGFPSSSGRGRRVTPGLEDRPRDIVERERGIETKDFLEFIHAVDFGAHRNIRYALENEFKYDRHAVLLHQLAGCREGLLEFVRAFDADRLAAE